MSDEFEFSDDYQPVPKTPRHLVADEAARLIVESGLAEVYGGKVERHPEGKCYRVQVSRKKTLDGSVNVYSPTYILVMWRTTARGIDPEGRRVYASLEAALAFLQLAFIDGDAAAALAIPVYEPKRRKKAEPKQESGGDEREQRQQQAERERQASPEGHVPDHIPEDFFGGDPPPADGPLDDLGGLFGGDD